MHTTVEITHPDKTQTWATMNRQGFRFYFYAQEYDRDLYPLSDVYDISPWYFLKHYLLQSKLAQATFWAIVVTALFSVAVAALWLLREIVLNWPILALPIIFINLVLVIYLMIAE